MATYKQIFGKEVKFLSSDPATEGEGQIWYNSTSSTFKSVLVTEAWSSGAPLRTARLAGSGFGIQTAAVLAGGRIGPPGGTTATEEYNGSGWEAANALNTSKQYSAGAGILTAGLSFGGDSPPGSALAKTEEYNGTTWTENPSPSGDMGTGRAKMAGFGVLTSAVAAGGGPPVVTTTEEYTGTTWAAGTALSQARQYLAGAGAGIPAGLVFGGTDGNGTKYADTEEYNGSAWTAGGDLNTARGQIAGCGTQTAALAIAGSPSPTATESYDGSTWATSPATLATARYDTNGIGTSTLALVAGGDPGVLSATEEYNKTQNVITAAAWATGGTLSNPFHGGNSAFGSTPAGAHVGGTTPTGPITANTELYDGSTWSSNPNACPFNVGYGTGGGPQTAGLICSGESPPGSGKSTAKFDGLAWTNAPNRSTAAQNAVGIGTQASFIQVGGEFPPGWTALTAVETFNDVTWATEPNSYPTGFVKGFAGGTAAAAIFGGGDPNPTGASNTWDGSAWTAAPVMIYGQRYAGAWAGTSTDAFAIGGYDTPSGGYTDVGVYDGTVWATSPSTVTGTSDGSAAGQTGGAGGVIKMGGNYGTQTSCDEFAASTTAVNYRTITTS